MRLISSYLATAVIVGAFALPVQGVAKPFSTLKCTERLTSKNGTDEQTIQMALSELNTYKNLQAQLGIQNVDLSFAMRKALVMANLLIGEDGSLNLSLCSKVKSVFIPQNPEAYEQNMSKILDQLNAEWVTFFSNVKASNDEPQSLVVRALFSLSKDAPITDRHAKVAVLCAMLAPFNQGPVGDCFAISDMIRDHREYYMHSAKDYQSLVANGYVSRLVDESMDYFFFLPVLADTDRDQAFTLNTSDALFAMPGFAAARDLMGANEIPGFLENVMSQLAGHKKRIQVTPSQVIDAMAQVAASHLDKTSVDELRSLGEYGFSSLTNNPVLRGIEAAFAMMAEDRPNDSTRGNINDSINQALHKTWKELEKSEGAAQFKTAFEQSFNSSYRLIYNLDIPLPQVASDGSSSSGGYQLYQRIANHPEQLGNRMATPEDLRTLIINAVGATKEQLADKVDPKIAEKLLSVVQTDNFLNTALWAYDPNNEGVYNPVKNYEKLARTPMQSCDGDNPYEVDDIDTGITYDNDVQSYTPSDPKDLLTWALQLAKSAPKKLIPMDSPQHAFNFDPTNSDIAAFLQKEMSISQWIQNVLMIPGVQVSRKPVDAATQTAMADALYPQLQNALADPQDFVDLMKDLKEKNLSIKDYANQLVEGVNGLLNLPRDESYQIGLLIDALLLQSLPTNEKAILSQSAIRFALTNWNEGSKDIYFCAFFNPRTETIGFGMMMEDKTGLQPMDERQWVDHQRWDVDLKPFSPKNQRLAI